MWKGEPHGTFPSLLGFTLRCEKILLPEALG